MRGGINLCAAMRYKYYFSFYNLIAFPKYFNNFVSQIEN